MILVYAAAAMGQTAGGAVKICRGVPIPEGYVIVAFITSPVCPNGAYMIKKEPASPAKREAASVPASQGSALEAEGQVTRPRIVGNAGSASEPQPNEQKRAPVLRRAAAPTELEVEEKPIAASRSGPEEVGEGDVLRVDTTLVTVPVSVSDRDGRFVPDLRREEFKLFEDGEEQTITYFEETEKPFTVALMLDTSASTSFKLDEIKEAAIRFASQLRPQDRVLVVTFNNEVLLLTEATNDRAIINEVIQLNAQTGNTTRLYDAIELLVRKRLDKIVGRKAIVLFTDGVDTASHFATHASSMYMAEELDALIYPIQYDTFNDMNTPVGGGGLSVYSTRRRSGRAFPGDSRTSTPGDILNSPSSVILRVMREAYEQANQYLRGLAEKTGGRLYRADDPAQLAQAFSMIAKELSQQYSLGYYPKSPELAAGERRQIRVRLQRAGLAVRARDSYIATAGKRDGEVLR
jgi:VWFA-related protein